MKSVSGGIFLLMMFSGFLNTVKLDNQVGGKEYDEILSKSGGIMGENSKSRFRKPVLALIDKKLDSYEALRELHEIVHSENENNYPAHAANEAAGKSDPNMKSNQIANSSMSWNNPGILAGVICTCLVLGLILLLLVVFCIYRLRKRDEGSYALDEPKKMLPPLSEYSKAPTREFYA